MNTLNGLPIHIILVHAVVVLLPLTAGWDGKVGFAPYFAGSS